MKKNGQFFKKNQTLYQLAYTAVGFVCDYGKSDWVITVKEMEGTKLWRKWKMLQRWKKIFPLILDLKIINFSSMRNLSIEFQDFFRYQKNKTIKQKIKTQILTRAKKNWNNDH